MSKIKQGGLRVPSMQCNVNGDDEALSLTTIKETEWLNHMRQNVEDHQQREREREREREGERERETKRIYNPLLPSKLEMEKPLQEHNSNSIMVCLPRRTTETRKRTMPEFVAASFCRSCALYSHDQAYHNCCYESC